MIKKIAEKAAEILTRFCLFLIIIFLLCLVLDSEIIWEVIKGSLCGGSRSLRSLPLYFLVFWFVFGIAWVANGPGFHFSLLSSKTKKFRNYFFTELLIALIYLLTFFLIFLLVFTVSYLCYTN